jgi:MoaA/NifB/PqqE/SkfB family radical SAM enzyme
MEMSLEDLRRHIDNFYLLGTRIFFLQGGEPFLRKDIGDLVAYIKSKGCYCSISTNGTIHSRLYDVRGVDHIEFSLDGPPGINDKTRGVGAFEKTLQAASIAKQCGYAYHFHSVLNVHNMAEENVRYVARLAQDRGTYMTACFAMASGFDNNRSFIGEVEDALIKEGYRMLLRLQREGLPIHNSRLALEHALHWPLPYGEIGYEANLGGLGYKERCIHGRLTAWLDHDGWLYPCTIAFGREHLRTKIEDGGVRAAWDRLAGLTCVDCGIASDLTYLFGLRIENLLKIKDY